MCKFYIRNNRCLEIVEVCGIRRSYSVGIEYDDIVLTAPNTDSGAVHRNPPPY